MMQQHNSFLIGPEGEIYKCWNDVGHEDRIVGNIFQSELINPVRMYRYLCESSIFADAKCKDCNVFPICDGGCGHYRYRNTFEDANFDYCTRFKDQRILEESLLDTAERS